MFWASVVLGIVTLIGCPETVISAEAGEGLDSSPSELPKVAQYWNVPLREPLAPPTMSAWSSRRMQEALQVIEIRMALTVVQSLLAVAPVRSNPDSSYELVGASVRASASIVSAPTVSPASRAIFACSSSRAYCGFSTVTVFFARFF